MLPQNNPDRIQITFDDPRLVANAGLLLPATLARHLGLPEFVRQRLDLGNAPGRAATASTTPMRCVRGGPPRCWGAWSKRPPPPAFARAGSGDVPAQLPVGPCPPAGPGEHGPLTIDLDSTICETCGLAKEGARHHSLPPRKRRAAAGRLGGTLSLPLPGQ